MATLRSLVCAFILTLGAQAHAATLAEVETLYAAGDYQATARTVNEILVKDAGLSKGLRAKVYLMKARVELAFGRPIESRLWLEKAHRDDPELTLDPVKDPPALVSTWTAIQAAASSETSKTSSTAASPSRVVAFAPFGLPQARRGDIGKGLALATVQGALLGGAALASDALERKRYAGLFALAWVYGAVDSVAVTSDGERVALVGAIRF